MPLAVGYHGNASYSVASGATATILTVPAGDYGTYPLVAIGDCPFGNFGGTVDLRSLQMIYSGGSLDLDPFATFTQPYYLLNSQGAGFPDSWADPGFTIRLTVNSTIASGDPQRGQIAIAVFTGMPTYGIFDNQLGGIDNRRDTTNPDSGSFDLSAFPTQAVLAGIAISTSHRTPSTGATPDWSANSNWTNVDSSNNVQTFVDLAVTIGAMLAPPTSTYSSWTISNIPNSTRNDEYIAIVLDIPPALVSSRSFGVVIA